MAHAMKKAIAILLTLGMANGVMAEILPDPTRPPVALEPGAAGQAAGVAGLQLQSILAKPGSKPRAMINGEWLEQGKKIGEYRVLRIDPETVILRGPGGKETLGLTPAVNKMPAAKRAGEKR